MNDIQIQFENKKLFLNDNSQKFTRAKAAAGPNASDFELLAYYDHLAGLIQDEKGQKLENGQFWQMYENWRDESKKMIEMMYTNLDEITETESKILPILNENVAQKRSFLGTLMTIAAAIIAGLFFMFSKDYIPSGCATALAKFSGIFYSLFIAAATVWLTLIMSQEGTKLDKQLDFYRSLRADLLKKVGTAIRSKKDFDLFLKEKLDQSIKLSDKKVLGAEEYFFWIVTGLFIAASAPVVILFLLAGNP